MNKMEKVEKIFWGNIDIGNGFQKCFPTPGIKRGHKSHIKLVLSCFKCFL